ncbi:MAG: exosortase system-associated protein, TIGR04073 family [Lentisphaeria bacterium]|nr:exosortase system-associated protein, TIGR04073 family [Lentisphaeria bacterium]
MMILMVASAFSFGEARAADIDPMNMFFVKAELYVWNRFADFCEMVRFGAGVGPSIGVEVAATEYIQLGAYAANEKGVTFPGVPVPFVPFILPLPPLWLVPYFEDEVVHQTHSGNYATASFGPWRKETSLVASERFERDPYNVRAQLGLGIVHGYVSVESKEVADFFTGIPDILQLVGINNLGTDLCQDDAKLDPTAVREPANQLGRGIANVLVGVLEVPTTMMRVGKEQGDFAGATAGLAHGVWRFAVREVVGVFEVITFPFGWEPMIEPAYPLQPARVSDWDLRKPAFMSKY